jgi:membrane-bound serine protease (ClpP class)
VELDVVDLVAADRTELLAAIDGLTVRLPEGEVTVETADAAVVEEPMSPFEEILKVLSDPNIALILLSLGTLGIYFELSNPGAFFPGIFGAIALVLALFSLGTLPINLSPGWRCCCSVWRCWAPRSGSHRAACWASAAGSPS